MEPCADGRRPLVEGSCVVIRARRAKASTLVGTARNVGENGDGCGRPAMSLAPMTYRVSAWAADVSTRLRAEGMLGRMVARETESDSRLTVPGVLTLLDAVLAESDDPDVSAFLGAELS